MLEKFFDVVADNLVGSICIFLSGILLLCSGLKNIEFGPLEFSVENSSRKSMQYLGISLLALGLVSVADFSSAFSFASILDNSQGGRVISSIAQVTPIQKLHKAAEKWDTMTAMEAVQELEITGEKCDQILATNVRSLLAAQGESGLNYLNLLQENITVQYPECRYPKLDHSDQY